MTETKEQQWPIKDLKRNDRQDSNFHDLDDRELSRLAEDMKANGQTTAIEVLPGGMIIDGHQRLRAAEFLEWTEVRVRVRDDLQNKRRAAEKRMIQANLSRRQLHTLDQVRIAIRTCELEHKCRPGELGPFEQVLTRQLSELLSMSKRNVRRWLWVARAPMPVQLAVQEGKLNLVDAVKVARMDKASQQHIAEAIECGKDPMTLVGEELRATPRAKTMDLNKEFGKFIDSIVPRLDAPETGVPALERGSSSAQDLEIISWLETFLTRVKPVLRKQARRFREDTAGVTNLGAHMPQKLTRTGAL